MATGIQLVLAMCFAIAECGLASPDAARTHNFQNVARGQNDGSLASDFRGSVTYNGTIDATLTREPSTVSRLSARSAGQTQAPVQTTRFSETIQANLQFDGPIVTGTFSGSGQVERGTLRGTRSGDTCVVFSQSGIRWEGRCDAKGFSGQMNFTMGGQTLQASFRMQTTQLVDYVERDRLQAEQTQAAEARKRTDEARETARIRAMHPAGAALTAKLDGYVQADSEGWYFNRYRSGSMTNVRFASGSAASGAFILRGEFTYADGGHGWVLAKMSGGSLVCLEFWDSHEGCRPIRRPQATQTQKPDPGSPCRWVYQQDGPGLGDGGRRWVCD